MKTIPIKCTGYSIAADWYEGSEGEIMLVLPGFTSNKASQKEFASLTTEETGMSVMVLDYSGHGESPFKLGDTRPAQHFLEVICAFDWLAESYPNARITVAGSSYGSFLAVQLTKYRKFENLILRAPAIYRPNEFYNTWSSRSKNEEAYLSQIHEYRRDKDALTGHPLLVRASKFAGRTLVVIHEKDEIIPRETTDAYVKAFSADSFTAEGFTHTENQSPATKEQIAEYYQQIINWLKE